MHMKVNVLRAKVLGKSEKRALRVTVEANVPLEIDIEAAPNNCWPKARNYFAVARERYPRGHLLCQAHAD